MNKFAMYVTVTFGMAGFILLWALLWSIVVSWAWNMSMPHVSGGRLPMIDYWQAYGLIVVCGLVKSTATAADYPQRLFDAVLLKSGKCKRVPRIATGDPQQDAALLYAAAKRWLEDEDAEDDEDDWDEDYEEDEDYDF